MAHNFRPRAQLLLTQYDEGNWPASFVHVSKAGIPNNGGNGLPDSPYSKLAGLTGVLQVGTGHYNEPTINASRIIGDGKVIIRGTPGAALFSANIYAQYCNLDIGGFQYIYNKTSSSGGNNWVAMWRCILRGGEYTVYNDINTSSGILADCIVIGTSVTAYSGGLIVGPNVQIHNTLFINSPLVCIESILRPVKCYFDANSALTVPSSGLPLTCNIRGSLTIDGVLYNTLQEAAVVWPALLTDGNISQNPQFNKPESEDFSLKIQSPHLNTGIGPRHLRFGQSFYVEKINGASSGDTVTTSNCILRSTANPAYTIAVLQTSGLQWNDQGGVSIKPNTLASYEAFILFDRIRVSDVPRRLNRWSIVAGLNMDTDFPSYEPTDTQDSANPSVFNNSVPDYSNFNSGSAGRNPNRLGEQFRWTNNANPGITPSDNSDWQTGSSFLEFEMDADLNYNASPLVGNADPTYNPSAGQPVIARWIQPRLKLRNNYYSR